MQNTLTIIVSDSDSDSHSKVSIDRRASASRPALAAYIGFAARWARETDRAALARAAENEHNFSYTPLALDYAGAVVRAAKGQDEASFANRE